MEMHDLWESQGADPWVCKAITRVGEAGEVKRTSTVDTKLLWQNGANSNGGTDSSRVDLQAPWQKVS